MAPPAISSVMLTGLTEDHFGDLSAAALDRRIIDIVARGGTIDFRTVVQGGASVLMGEGGSINALMARMAAIAAPAGSLADYAKIIRSAWVVRRIFDAADGARSQIATSDVTALARGLIDSVDALRDAATDQRRSSRGSLGDIAEQAGREAEAMMRGELERPPSCGIPDLDKHLPMRGLAPGALYVLAGRTGQGKTLMGSALASKMSGQGEGTLYYSLEVPSKEIAARVICERLGSKGPTYGQVLSGHTSENELEAYLWAAAQAKQEPLRLDDTPALSMADNRHGSDQWRAHRQRHRVLDAQAHRCPTRRRHLHRTDELSHALSETRRQRRLCLRGRGRQFLEGTVRSRRAVRDDSPVPLPGRVVPRHQRGHDLEDGSAGRPHCQHA